MKPLIPALVLALACQATSGSTKPLIGDFLGLNGHFQFKPKLYRPVCGLVRNYHNMDWDVQTPGDSITLPHCINKVNWNTQVYGKWAEYGFETDISLQFSSFGSGNKAYRDLWNGQSGWTQEYGFAMADYFGSRNLATSIEIGNEPGNGFDDTLYQKLFIAMARGIREANPDIKIVTAAAHARKADKYSKSLNETFSSPEMMELYDVINLHTYPIKPKSKDYSPWDRSYPEDPQLDYLKMVDEAIAWRNRHAEGKEIWITEFGYDACTPAAMGKREGWFKKLNWQDVTDEQQAQYLIRSLLCFAERDIDRAYIYFYNDSDKASVHAASGLTRNFEPKPAYWAAKHFYEILGDYRFNRVIQKERNGAHVFEFVKGGNPREVIWVAWLASGSGTAKAITLRNLPGKLLGSEQMPINKGLPVAINPIQLKEDTLRCSLGETPVYFKFAR